MSVRIRRLEADWKALREALNDHPNIQIEGTAGNPPQKYHIRYRIKGLEQKPQGEIVEKNEHLVEVTLLRAYPHQPPVCRMLDPVFHPNIAPHVICIGDNWAAGESLVQIVFQIGQMIAYQSYNIKSPLNGEAARWTEENLESLPLDNSSLTVPQAALLGKSTGSDMNQKCANCQKTCTENQMWKCSNGHPLCQVCQMICFGCGQQICTICNKESCAICFQQFCHNCLLKCQICQRHICVGHTASCLECGQTLCHQCLTMCSLCGKLVCHQHEKQCQSCGHSFCLSHVSPASGRCHQCDDTFASLLDIPPENNVD